MMRYNALHCIAEQILRRKLLINLAENNHTKKIFLIFKSERFQISIDLF